MIGFLPDFYKDELAYSVLARYYARSGHMTYTGCAEDLFESVWTSPDEYFYIGLKKDVLELLKRSEGIDAVIREHTMYGAYAGYLDRKRAERAYASLRDGTGDYLQALVFTQSGRGSGESREKGKEVKSLRYCPICAMEDRKKHGEAYWHRAHQIEHVKVCVKHRCRLKESRVKISGKASPDLVPLEEVVGEEMVAGEIEERMTAGEDLNDAAASGRVDASGMPGGLKISGGASDDKMSSPASPSWSSDLSPASSSNLSPVPSSCSLNVSSASTVVSDDELSIASYVISLFNKGIKWDEGADIREWLHSKLFGTEYVSKRGGARKMTRLHGDIKARFAQLPDYCNQLKVRCRLEKLFTGDRGDFYEMAQLLWFLGVEVDDACHVTEVKESQSEDFDAEIRKLKRKGIGSNQIARMLGVSSKTVRDVLNGLEGGEKIRKAKNYRVKCGPKERNWEEYDKEHLEAVREYIREAEGCGGRPYKVSMHGAVGRLGLPDKALDKMPLCRSEVMKAMESQQRYWARELLWAYRTGNDKGGEMNWRRLRNITNMRNRDALGCLEELEQMTDAEEFKRIRGLLPEQGRIKETEMQGIEEVINVVSEIKEIKEIKEVAV